MSKLYREVPMGAIPEVEGPLDDFQSFGYFKGKLSRARLGGSVFASALQGEKADTAVQPEDLATVAFTGFYSSLSGKPTLGTAASHDVEEFASAAQLSVPTIADLLELEALPGAVAVVLGRTVAGDLGGGMFRWDDGSTATVDDGTIFGEEEAGRWLRLIGNDWSTAWFGIEADGNGDKTDATIALNAAMQALSDRGGGVMRLEAAAIDPFYINATLRIPNGVTLQGGRNELLYGPSARGFMQGRLDDGTYRGRIEESVEIGDTIIPLPAGSTLDHTNYSVGDYIIIRGENDAAGDSIWHDNCVITDIDTDNNTITVSPALSNDYDPTYPDSVWVPESGSDDTIIVIIAKSNIAVESPRLAATLEVADGSIFAVGEIVCIEDLKLGSDVSGTSKNQFHLETNKIIAIDGNELTFAMPLAHAYETAYSACVQKIIPVLDAAVRDVVIRYDELSADNNRYALATKYAVDCGMTGCRVLGDPLAGKGSRSHCFRLGEGSWECFVNECVASRPINYGSGQGYGATIYAGARKCRITNSYFEGCRHSVLLFSGVSDNLVANNVSADCRGTDYDCHGAEECNNLFIGNKAIGGPSTTEEGPGGFDIKAAFKHGNPTHRVGGIDNAFIANEVVNYTGYAFHAHPGRGAVFKGNVVRNCSLGASFLQRNSNDTALKILDTVIADNTVISTDRLVYADGSAAYCVEGLTIEGNSVSKAPAIENLLDLYYCDGVRAENNRLHSLAGTDAHMVRFRYCTGLRASRFTLEGGDKGVYLTNAPYAVLTHFDFFGIGERIIYEDTGASSDGVIFDDYEAFGFDPLFIIGADAEFRPRRLAHAKAVSELSRPTAVDGATYALSPGTSDPDPTDGMELVVASIKPRRPLGEIEFIADIPMINTDTATVAVALVVTGDGTFADVVGVKTVRLPTTGASSGSGLSVMGSFEHDLEDLADEVTVSLRLSLTGSGATLNINSHFNPTNVPTLRLREVG